MKELTPFKFPGTSAFDILFKNFFETETEFAPFNQIRFNYPVDIYTTEEGMNIDIACVGVDKKDLDIKIEGDILRVEYKKDSTEEDTKIDYIQKGIARRAFNMGWRISRRYDLGKLDAKLENGLLQLHMPITAESKPKKVTIK
jgi:HSP20 family protein